MTNRSKILLFGAQLLRLLRFCSEKINIHIYSEQRLFLLWLRPSLSSIPEKCSWILRIHIYSEQSSFLLWVRASLSSIPEKCSWILRILNILICTTKILVLCIPTLVIVAVISHSSSPSLSSDRWCCVLWSGCCVLWSAGVVLIIISLLRLSKLFYYNE